MSTWLTETEFRQSGARATGVTLNVAFMQEIKEDSVQFREVLAQTADQLNASPLVAPKVMVDSLIRLQDELETHFALEEFYGYFQNALVTNPSIGPCAEKIRSEHRDLFLQLNGIVDLAEQVLYHECALELTRESIAEKFTEFQVALDRHEQAEMDLMMRLCNEEIGVGD